ncbi:histidine phosphatase family protein [uncultured Paenibacillus sp.]|uniref:histidine phosphatase family protein n=1 Tax=uncultured Paenibacillus sp. TaxID=227322 RepID=UPI0015B364FD|nr:histidine phosphatase family protein [uncultured Paenibacillus sp.]
MKRIYLIRHCKANGQEPAAELTEEGLFQAEQLADLLGDQAIDGIVSSPYQRAISTIQPLAKRLDLPVQRDDRLSERILSSNDLPNWMDHLRLSFEDLDLKLPGGESSREAMTRGVGALQDLIQRPDKNIVLVTHGNLMSLILKYYDDSFGFEAWRRLSNPDVFELGFFSDKGRDIKRLWIQADYHQRRL